MRIILTRLAFAAIIGLLPQGAAQAAVTPQAYREAGIELPPKAAVPLDAAVTDESGRRRPLGDLIAKPTVLVFADYTCRTLCGPIVAFAAAALEHSGLRPGDQFRLVVIGLDPKDTLADATRMRREHIGGDAALDRATTFANADAATIQRLTVALGYHYSYDEEHDQYVHPGAIFVLNAGGHVVRTLTGLGLSGDDVRLALVEASEGRIGTVRDRVRLLCSGFDPAHGTYNVVIGRVLTISATATVLALGGGIGLLALRGRRHTA